MGQGLRCLARWGWLRGGWRVLLVGLVAGCQAPIAPPEPTPPTGDPVEDHEGPTLETQPITVPQALEEPVVIEATADDPSGVYAVLLHFKPSNTDWQSMRMTQGSDSGTWRIELSADQLSGASSVSYYLEAADGTPYHNTSYSPSTGSESPYRFNILF